MGRAPARAGAGFHREARDASEDREDTARIDMMVRASLCLLVLGFAPAAGSAEARAASSVQDPTPDKRPEVEALVTELKEHAGKEGAEDKEAIVVIDKLLQEFPKSGPKDKAAIVAGLSKCFEEKRRPNADGVRDSSLYRAAAMALGQMGPDATKAILKWIGQKEHKKDIPLQNDLIRSLGRTKDKTAVPELIKLLEHKDAPLVGAAAEALGEFDTAELDVRKKAFEGMLKVLMSAKGAKDSDLQDTIARDRYDTIAAPIITSLGKLSKHDERDPDEWQRWWNKNKGKDWDSDA
jgi:HEAT repeat protein